MKRKKPIELKRNGPESLRRRRLKIEATQEEVRDKIVALSGATIRRASVCRYELGTRVPHPIFRSIWVQAIEELERLHALAKGA